MAFNINDFMGKYKDFSRSYLFYCKILGGPAGLLPTEHAYLVDSTSLPAQTIDPLTTNWQGHAYKIAGNSTYADFTITFKSDVAHTLRRGFLSWTNTIHNPVTNVHGTPGETGGYFSTVVLEQLNTIGDVIQTYNLVGAWPSSVGEMALAYGTKELQTFSVTFNYQYHTISGVNPVTIKNTGM